MLKKAFTLLELLIVILLISLLMASIRQIFTYKQRDFIKANWCVANIVWKSLNYFYSALTSKWLFTWWKLYFPKKYLLVLSGWNIQKVSFLFSTWGDNKIYNIISLTGNWEDNKYGCFSSKYYVKLSGDLSILMTPWLESKDGKIGIIINNDVSNITWEIYFYFVGYWYTGKILWKLFLDKRAENFYYSSCLIWTWWWTKCKVWSK